MTKKGFSLIEVIIAIAILGVIGVITSTLFSRVYQGSNKSELIGRVKQSGQVALNVIDEAIRTADAIVCYRYDPNNPARKTGIVLRNQNGKLISYRFEDPTQTTNGYIAKQDSNLNLNLSGSNCTFALNPANESPITDTNTTSGVSISQGQFILPIVPSPSTPPSAKDTVTIKFNAGPGVKPPTGLEANLGTPNYVIFQTTVQVR